MIMRWLIGGGGVPYYSRTEISSWSDLLLSLRGFSVYLKEGVLFFQNIIMIGVK